MKSYLQSNDLLQRFIFRCFRFSPQQPAPSEDEDDNYMIIDGEKMRPGPVQGQMRPGVCQLMVKKHL